MLLSSNDSILFSDVTEHSEKGADTAMKMYFKMDEFIYFYSLNAHHNGMGKTLHFSY